ncbi:MAG: CBS domain-containing protein [Nitrososphaerota archaeon]
MGLEVEGENGILTVKMFMSTNPLTISENATIREAAVKMAERGVGAIFVESDGKVLGIVTERDIVRRVVANKLDPDKVKVSEIMSKPLIAMDPDASVEDALRAMFENKVRRLAVIKDKTLVGIVTISDLAKALLKKIELIEIYVSAATRRLPMYE